MSTLLSDPKHWRLKAQEMRAAADDTGNDAERAAFLRLAKEYEGLAVRAEARVAKEPGKDHHAG